MKAPEFEAGDVGFVMHHNNWISRQLGWFMKSKWSHAVLVYGKFSGGTLLVETTDYEVTYTRIEDKYLNDPEVSLEMWRPVRLSEEERKAIAERAAKWVGEEYGWLQIFSFAVVTLLARVGIKIKNFVRQGMVCNHVVSYGYQGSNVPLMDLPDPENYHTEQVYRMVMDGVYPDGAKAFKLIFMKNRGEVCQ